jgi:hypothetical protein
VAATAWPAMHSHRQWAGLQMCVSALEVAAAALEALDEEDAAPAEPRQTLMLTWTTSCRAKPICLCQDVGSAAGLPGRAACAVMLAELEGP